MNLNRISTNLAAVSLLGAGLLLTTPAQADVPNSPPSVSIISPTDGQMFDGPTATIDVYLEAFGGDEGIARIDLRVDGATVMTDADTPYGFEGVELTEGMHTLEAVAVSAAGGGDFPSEPVEIVVLEGTGGSEEAKGCSVGTGTQIGSALALVCLFGLSLIGRRRED